MHFRAVNNKTVTIMRRDLGMGQLRTAIFRHQSLKFFQNFFTRKYFFQKTVFPK